MHLGPDRKGVTTPFSAPIRFGVRKERAAARSAEYPVAGLLAAHTRCFLGPQGADHKSTAHPLWDQAIKMLEDTSVAPSLSTPVEGYSRTISEHLQQLSTAESNMWSGAIYPKSLDYLIRILLRLHLAPKREASYKERVA